MSTGTIDIRDEAAELLGELGRRAQYAARYRTLATTVAEPAFDRAIAIGSEIRQADRAGRSALIAAAVDELREQLRRCEEGIRDVQTSAIHRALVGAYAAADVEHATELAVSVFAGVTNDAPRVARHWPVSISGGRSADHFISPERCVATIRRALEEGIAAPEEAPALGGDDHVRPVRLTSSADAAESPITLLFEPDRLPGPLGALGEDVGLWYAERLQANFTVTAAATVSDEWWEIRPDAYDQYVTTLGRVLAEAGLSLSLRSETRALG